MFYLDGWTLHFFEQVQPDMEELDANMEDNEGAEEEKEEVNLGKLQFSLDYDFQKNEVQHKCVDILKITTYFGYSIWFYTYIVMR